jgi:hypothetical protein
MRHICNHLPEEVNLYAPNFTAFIFRRGFFDSVFEIAQSIPVKECPSSFCTDFRSTPDRSSLVAYVADKQC